MSSINEEKNIEIIFVRKYACGVCSIVQKPTQYDVDIEEICDVPALVTCVRMFGMEICKECLFDVFMRAIITEQLPCEPSSYVEEMARRYNPTKVRIAETDTQRLRREFTNKGNSFRRKILERYQYRCVFCGDYRNLHIDHVVPLSKGGTNDESNLQVLCRTCNLKKSNI